MIGTLFITKGGAGSSETRGQSAGSWSRVLSLFSWLHHRLVLRTFKVRRDTEPKC